MTTMDTREFLGVRLSEHHARLFQQAARLVPAHWSLRVTAPFVMDRAGYELILGAIRGYRGRAARLHFLLSVDNAARRDYYSLQPSSAWTADGLRLPIEAQRDGGEGIEIITIALPAFADVMPLPEALGDDLALSVPLAVLMPLTSDYDVLFANQMGIFSALHRAVRRRPLTWLAACRDRRPFSFGQRAALAYRAIHPQAQVHPTAVIEGSVIGRGAVIGAHAVVRYSVIGESARLFDGAKVEFSVVGAKTCLMHDLVLYRSVAERDVFLIHGPYQFSLFQRASSAFATILMDYRPDGRAIQVQTPSGLRAYEGRFLGAVLQERAKLLGGCLLAPGRTVPPDTWLSAESASVHTLGGHSLPTRVPISPQTARKEPHGLEKN